MSIISYGATIHLEKSGKALKLELIEHSIDYDKRHFTYTTEDRRMGIIPYDRIMNIEFDPRLFQMKQEQDKNKEDKIKEE